jgi:glycosyltransferase involved in cell wall biosynthesis
VSAASDPTGHAADAPGRVHLVYPHGDSISTPDAIGRELGRRLAARYEVIFHDWSDLGAIQPEPGDVLLGHPHPHPDSVFRRSLREKGWRRRLMMAPFHHGDLRQIAFEDGIVPQCDQFLAITGSYWFRTIGDSRCSHWRPKVVPLEHAVDRRDFPPLKTSLAESGKRRVVYIGHSGRGKGAPYLSEIAALVPEAEFAWMGRGRPIPGVTALGQIDFSSQAGKDLVSKFDFLLTVGNADSNPTTILESMAWGLIPICTPTCGYEGVAGITNVPNGDPESAAAIVRRLLFADESDLLAMQSANWRRVDEYYNWDRFAADVTKAIESEESPPVLPESLKRRLIFTFYDLTSPYGRIAYGRAGRLLSRLRRRWRRNRLTQSAAKNGGSSRG